MEQVKTLLKRIPRELPTLVLSSEKDSIFEYEVEDVSFEGYDPHPKLKAPIAV